MGGRPLCTLERLCPGSRRRGEKMACDRTPILALLVVALLPTLSFAKALEHSSNALKRLYVRCVDPARPSSELFKDLKPLPAQVQKEMINDDTISIAYNLS